MVSRSPFVRNPLAKSKAPAPIPETLHEGFSIEDGCIFYAPSSAEHIYVCQKVTVLFIKRDIDADAFSFEIQFDYHNHRKVLTVPRATCLTKKGLLSLQNEGLDITEKSAIYAVMYFQNEEHRLKDRPFQQFHSTLGFGKLGSADIFKAYNALATDSQYSGPLDIKPAGSEQAWENLTRKYIIGHPEREAMLSIGFSSAIIGMLGLDSLFVHLSGNSTSGKTTMAKFAISIWGNPSTKADGLARSWFGTTNAIMQGLSGNHGIPILLDEVSMNGTADFSEFTYAINGNREKSRLTEESERKQSGSWATTILSTGEFGLLEKSKRNTGLRMRLLQFENVSWTDSAETADAILACISANYGFAGMKFAQYLMDAGSDAVREGLSRAQCEVMKEMSEHGVEDKFSSRRAWKYALILLSAEVANNVFDFGIDMQKLGDFLLTCEQQSSHERDLAQAALTYLSGQINQNGRKFISRRGNELQEGIPGSEVWGCIKVVKDQWEVSILEDVFKRIMREGGFESPNVILKEWKARGILNADSDRFTRDRKLLPSSPASPVYVICFKENPDNDQD